MSTRPSSRPSSEEWCRRPAQERPSPVQCSARPYPHSPDRASPAPQWRAPWDCRSLHLCLRPGAGREGRSSRSSRQLEPSRYQWSHPDGILCRPCRGPEHRYTEPCIPGRSLCCRHPCARESIRETLAWGGGGTHALQDRGLGSWHNHQAVFELSQKDSIWSLYCISIKYFPES